MVASRGYWRLAMALVIRSSRPLGFECSWYSPCRSPAVWRLTRWVSQCSFDRKENHVEKSRWTCPCKTVEALMGCCLRLSAVKRARQKDDKFKGALERGIGVLTYTLWKKVAIAAGLVRTKQIPSA